jgi:hypothetical protein
MTERDDRPPYTPYINAEEVRARRSAGERLGLRYEALPWTKQPSFIAVYTMPDGAERAFVSSRVRRRGFRDAVGPKELSAWPGVWAHHRKLGDGGPLVLPVINPIGGAGESDDDE